MPEIINPDDHSGAELKKLAQDEGVATTGNKQELADRINEARAAKGDEPVDAGAPTPDGVTEDTHVAEPVDVVPTVPGRALDREPDVASETEVERKGVPLQIGENADGHHSVVSDHFRVTESLDRYRGMVLVSIARVNAVGTPPLVMVREEFEEFAQAVAEARKQIG